MRLTLKDAPFANAIMGSDDVYPYTTDDHCDPANRGITGTLILQNPLLYLLSPNEHSLFFAIPRTMTMYECHTMVLPAGRGGVAVKAALEAAIWMFENTTCEKLIGYTPVTNRKAIAFNLKCGFRKEGICTRSWKKNGRLIDQVMFGLEKERLWELKLRLSR